jgi:hypothetical protein
MWYVGLDPTIVGLWNVKLFIWNVGGRFQVDSLKIFEMRWLRNQLHRSSEFLL